MTAKYSYWIHSGKYAMMQKLFSIILGMLSFMLLARVFDPEDFGVWGLFVIISSIIETCRNALVKNGYIRFINSTVQEERPVVEAAALFINTAFTLLLFFALIFLGPHFADLLHAHGLGEMLQWSSIGILFLGPFSWFENLFYSRYKFREIFWIYFIRNTVFFATTIFWFLSGTIPSKNLVVIFYSLSILPSVIYALLVYMKDEPVRFRHSFLKVREFLRYSKYVLGNNFFSLVFVSADSFMTSRFVSPFASSFYSTGARLLHFADIPSQVFGDIMFPRAAQLATNGTVADVRNIYEKTVAASLTLILPMVLFVLLFTKWIILFLVGEKYIMAVPVIRLLIFYSLFLPFLKQFGNIMDARGKPHVNFWLMLFIAFLNLVLNYLFIKLFGVYGAATGTLSTYVIVFIITQIVLFKTSQVLLNIPHLYKEYYIIALKGLRKFKMNRRMR